jgi:NodT family efflux transporter outer membrane factor (OMF) lipoprotein
VLKVQEQLLELLQRQYALGDVAQADVLTQQAALAQTQASLPPLQKSLAQQRDRLTALAGRFPSQELEQKFDLASLSLPQKLPLSLPSSLVRQRPDVRSAEAQLHAASAAVGIATANMLPQITLSANIGSAAAEMGNLFTSGTGLWGLAGGLTQPLFAGGALLHRKRASEALLEQAAAQYKSTVILAFQNVADSLRALQYDADALQAQDAAERAAARSLEISRRSVQLGETSPQTLLAAQQAYQQAVIGLAQAQAARFADTAALFQALGGGWWNRGELALNSPAR